ncbi:hypothetical protein ABB07_25785 [Streptomyces incarnatus]|uniref:Bacterial Ig domain-containing protein n=1 Tax=Streptomyces incarnatus TaxID=665007 RepID=A0ABM5TQP2_9ACTN|nr:hypothetical protein [Streptomyces incarnatus]AKJ13318.1 hypothetical protein ABB07_25785 [Streptomyces incarnatus]
MNSELRHHRYGRALGAGVLSVALLSGGTTGAFAATSTPTPSPTRTGMPTPTRTGMPTPTHTGMPTAMPSVTRTGKPSVKPSRTPAATGSITVRANRKAVKVGNTVVFVGRVRGVKSGSTLVLQHLHNGKWTTLKTTAVVHRNGTYAIKRTFTTKGTEQVRVSTKSGTLHSAPVTVNVS